MGNYVRLLHGLDGYEAQRTEQDDLLSAALLTADRLDPTARAVVLRLVHEYKSLRDDYEAEVDECTEQARIIGRMFGGTL